MIDTLLYLATIDPTLKARYVNKVNQRYNNTPNLQVTLNQPLTAANLKDVYDDLFKEHLRRGDVNKLLSNWKGDIDSSSKVQEQSMRMNYISAGGNMDWSSLSNLMQATGMAPTDAMIANFALTSLKADAIVTTDLDYMQVAGTPVLDVYMPRSLSVQATGIYDPNID